MTDFTTIQNLGWMTFYPSPDSPLMVEENSVFHPTQGPSND